MGSRPSDHTRKPDLVLLLALLVCAGVPAVESFTIKSEPQISIKGTLFAFEDGSPFIFLGGNLAFYRFMVQRGEVYTKAEIDEIVKNLATHAGAKMMRVGLSGPAFEPELGVYEERAFNQLDYVLAAAEKNDIRVIIALRDYVWAAWPPDAKDPYWVLGEGNSSKPNKNAILTESQGKKAYKNFIAHVLTRMNSVTGETYNDDPTVFAWDLLNDPPISDLQVLSSWVTEMGTYIRSIDKVHFLTIDTGDVSADWWDSGSSAWQVLGNHLIDFVTLHYYAPVSLYDPVDLSNVAKIKARLARALQLRKPVVFDEFGAEGFKNSLQSRMNLYRTVIETVLGNGGSGALFWSWGPLGPNGWGGPDGWDIYIDQWKELTGIVLQEAILWRGFIQTTTYTTATTRSTFTVTSSIFVPTTTSPTYATETEGSSSVLQGEAPRNQSIVLAGIGAVALSVVILLLVLSRRPKQVMALTKQEPPQG